MTHLKLKQNLEQVEKLLKILKQEQKALLIKQKSKQKSYVKKSCVLKSTKKTRKSCIRKSCIRKSCIRKSCTRKSGKRKTIIKICTNNKRILNAKSIELKIKK